MAPFRTHSTPLAAVLLHERVRLVDLERSPSSLRVEFLFENSEKLQDTVKRFWRGDLECPARSLLTSYREAKQLIHDCHP